MPLPAIRSGAVFSGDATGGTSFSISVPNHEDGDRLYVVFAQDGGGNGFTFTGWTLLLGPLDLDGTNTASMYTRIASNEPASYTLTSDTNERAAWVAWAVVNDGGASGTPLSSASTGGATSVNFMNYTTADPGCLLICVGLSDADTRPWSLPGALPQLGIFGTASGSTVGLYYFYPITVGQQLISGPTITGTQVTGAFQIAIKPDDTDPIPLVPASETPAQRIRTYPRP